MAADAGAAASSASSRALVGSRETAAASASSITVTSSMRPPSHRKLFLSRRLKFSVKRWTGAGAVRRESAVAVAPAQEYPRGHQGGGHRARDQQGARVAPPGLDGVAHRLRHALLDGVTGGGGRVLHGVPGVTARSCTVCPALVARSCTVCPALAARSCTVCPACVALLRSCTVIAPALSLRSAARARARPFTSTLAASSSTVS